MKRKPWADYVRIATPGPWAPGGSDRRSGRYIRPVAGGASICQITVHRRNWRENARMIAMVPDMYELLMDIWQRPGNGELKIRISKIIERVTGRDPFPPPNPWRCRACDALSQEPKTGCHHKEERDD